MSKRTLQRLLRAEGTTYAAILQQTRCSLAMHDLRNTGMSSAEIAFLLGVSETSSFHRAFRTWTGSAPEATRFGLATALR